MTGQRNQLGDVIVLLQLQLVREKQTDVHQQQQEQDFDPVAGRQRLPADPAIGKEPKLRSAIRRCHVKCSKIGNPGRGESAGGSLKVGEIGRGVNVSAAGVPW